jgi:hypothetical protein
MYVLHILFLPQLYSALSSPDRLIGAQLPVPVAEEEATQTDGRSTGEADSTNNCAPDSQGTRRCTFLRKLVPNQLLRAGYALVYRCLLYAPTYSDTYLSSVLTG